MVELVGENFAERARGKDDDGGGNRCDRKAGSRIYFNMVTGRHWVAQKLFRLSDFDFKYYLTIPTN